MDVIYVLVLAYLLESCAPESTGMTTVGMGASTEHGVVAHHVG